MSIFNSLGSNYSLSFSLLALRQLFFPNRQSLEKLKNILQKKFEGQVKLVWKGRDAIELCLTSYGIAKGDKVLTQAVTCYSIEEAILRVGAEVVYADVAPKQIGINSSQLKKILKANPKVKAIIIQHTLGYPNDIASIAKLCQENDILLIEDLAQSLGGKDKTGLALGSRADAIILSFGRDKIVDGISGGAVVFKKKVKKQIKIPFALPSTQAKQTLQAKKLIIKDLIYPFLTWLIRKTYNFGLGKALHFLSKKMGLFYSPIYSHHRHFLTLPAYYAPLILQSLKHLEAEIKHRRAIAHYYYNRLSQIKKIVIPVNQEQISRSTNLRFPLLITQPHNLIKFLQKKKIFLADRWYRRVVDAGTTQQKSIYQDKFCPEAEKVAGQLFNLPTHREISCKRAKLILDAILDWLKTTKAK
ncbi:MAG: aminotransferase class V-fold PLP-dependent enzyme [Patescibacteria group bacterium]|nr:aminotransferase class V-fold PLP-dependent enzyme [Patescibacteria group bacterium]